MLKNRLSRRFALAGAFTALLAAGAVAECGVDVERIVLKPPPGYRAELWPVGASVEVQAVPWAADTAVLVIRDAKGEIVGEAHYALEPSN